MNFFEMGFTAFSITRDVATLSGCVTVEPTIANEAFTSTLGLTVRRPEAYVVYRFRTDDLDVPETVVDTFEAMVRDEYDGFRKLVETSDLSLVEVVASLPTGESWDCDLPPSLIELCASLGVTVRVTITT